MATNKHKIYIIICVVVVLTVIVTVLALAYSGEVMQNAGTLTTPGDTSTSSWQIPAATSSEDNNQTASADMASTTTNYVYGDIVFQVIESQTEETNTLVVKQGGKVVTTETNGVIFPLGHPCNKDAYICDFSSSPTWGVDINGNGQKDFVFDGNSLGSDDENDYYVFELSKAGVLAELAQISVYGDAKFRDLDGDGRLDIQFGDGRTWDCWSSDCASTPFPNVVLSWDNINQVYKPNTRLMHKVAPTQSAIQKEASSFKGDNWCAGTPNNPQNCTVPWGYALDLIYSGNAASAKSYIDLVWPLIDGSLKQDDTFANFSSEADFKSQLLSRLQTSPYYTTILSLNGGKIF
jgi:hypothetical protein